MRDSPGEFALAATQLEAIDAWHRARRCAERAAGTKAASREMRMDLDRRLEVLRAQHQAIVEHAEASLRSSAAPVRGSAARRAVVAHRHRWFADRLCAELVHRGVQVVSRAENGATVVGVCVAEQPDLVVVEDRLAMLSGEDVVREVRRFCAAAVIVAQVPDRDHVAPMLEAGATKVHTRGVPPLDVSVDSVQLLEGATQLV